MVKSELRMGDCYLPICIKRGLNSALHFPKLRCDREMLTSVCKQGMLLYGQRQLLLLVLPK